ncbi:LON peptidase substrate-binding domain-containing protein [Marinobacterium rhizophilum]|uniref:LON peptidase substrate-binding domain-containing protein n=1 Tax=Marinobacterium rhizophilum TaxID=420402 RepID=A0ABY5HPE5_9GAMM|nr:LON peptidase substrate-binding domain-containing protein [Marinobacterium rhizophilum]UTW13751.1 LON peptidase substrate-binding domain-containing protein [Marinobacterium rhizophilum]
MELLPLFPLPVVLFPGSHLPLQIFEPRYLTMVSESFRHQRGFVIVQTRPGEASVDGQPPFFDLGVYGEIVDWDQLENERLGILVKGLRRVRIGPVRAQPDNLLLGECDVLAPEPVEPVLPEYAGLQRLLCQMLKHPTFAAQAAGTDTEDAVTLGYRLADWLPFSAQDKQELLACDGPAARLKLIHEAIDWDR